MTSRFPPERTPEVPARQAWPALKRGLAGRCPHCGEGRIFTSYLKVAPACSRCGEAFHHHRADDAPPYLTIFIVGHVILPLFLWVEMTWQPEMWIHFVVWIPLITLASLVTLPPVKGAVIAWQWALKMHGFDPESPEALEPPPGAPAPARPA